MHAPFLRLPYRIESLWTLPNAFLPLARPAVYRAQRPTCKISIIKLFKDSGNLLKLRPVISPGASI